ncbi:DNA/RNA nuclease SfsA, partial [Candidatus Thorarchaeota archaeon]
TDFTLVGIQHDGVRVSLDSNLPNRFLKRELLEHRIPQFNGYSSVQPEPPLYDGRFDFRLSGESGTTLIEVKSCTLVEDGLAVFPDAPTTRGARHVRHLAKALEDGVTDHAAVVFVIQRPDAHSFSTNDMTDPDFGEALRKAHENGVEVVPLSTRVVDWDLELVARIPYLPEAQRTTV